MKQRPIVYHIPVCPFCQRIEILLSLKGLEGSIDFGVIDITVPRPQWLLDYTGGSTALPILVDEEERVLKESLVILRYIEDRFPGRQVARTDPYERAVEGMMIAREGPFGAAGYMMVMNRDRARMDGLRAALLDQYRAMNEFLLRHNPDGTWLFDRFGLAEVVFTPLMMRFWFLDHYEGFALPESPDFGPDFGRVARWRAACLAHPAAQQVSYDQIVKLYYDYAVGSGNGALPEGRSVSSFVFTPDWRDRPMPPRDKYDRIAGDAELGLLG